MLRAKHALSLIKEKTQLADNPALTVLHSDTHNHRFVNCQMTTLRHRRHALSVSIRNSTFGITIIQRGKADKVVHSQKTLERWTTDFVSCAEERFTTHSAQVR